MTESEAKMESNSSRSLSLSFSANVVNEFLSSFGWLLLSTVFFFSFGVSVELT
jgi:hypothetical protein